MKIVTLRARMPDATPTHLHERITVLACLSAEDREALGSTFAALTEPASVGLEAVLRVFDTTVPLDDSFATTYQLLEAASCVIEVPSNQLVADASVTPGSRSPGVATADDAATGFDSPAEHANPASLARLRARREAVRSELTITKRAIEEYNVTSSAPALTASAPAPLTGGPSATMRELADQLGSALGVTSSMGAGDLADRLDQLSARRATLSAREAALAQLMSECRIAIDSVQDSIARGGSQSSPGAELLSVVEAIREEMIQLAGGTMSRRDRKRLGQLRSRESELLTSAGFTSYADLLASVRSHPADVVDELAAAAARLELLHELEGFWARRREQASADRLEEAELLTLAEQMLGEAHGPQPNPRLVAVKLRSTQPSQAPRESSTAVLAAQLAAEMGYGRSEGFTPRELLEMAEAEIEGADARVDLSESASQLSAFTESWSPTPASRGLADRKQELVSELEDIESRLAALERAVVVGAPDSAQSDVASQWSLTAELARRRSQPQVGPMPVLLLEPVGSPTALDALDVPTVVAHSARQQIIWVTDRPEVISGMETLGNLGLTIIA